jgi:CHAD domain-containing protein
MDFELAVDAGAAATLSRLKPLTACREGKPHTQVLKLVWFDSPEHTLLADGVTLTEQRGSRCLERIVPGQGTWLPGQPAPVLAAGPDPEQLPAPLAPLAAFDGRQTTSVHLFGDDRVTVAVRKGNLRAVTDERPAARIVVSGGETAVLAALRLIAEAVPATVPTASLAGEAIALATGQSPPHRRRGAPALPGDIGTVPDALAYILGHLTDVILALAPAAAGPAEESIEAVHQMRVAVRRARSALSMFAGALPPGAFDSIGAGLRDLGQRLGPTRDWDVFVTETGPSIQQAIPGDERLERLLGAAARRQRDCRKELQAYLASPAFRMLGIELAWFAAATFWRPLPAEAEAEQEPAAPVTLAAFASQVVGRRWKKLIVSGKHITELDIPALHGIRLRAKRTRYAAEMFLPLHRGKAAEKFIRRLSRLQEALGVLNDGSVAATLMDQLGGSAGRNAYAAGLVSGFMAARAADIRPRIEKSFGRFRRQDIYWG